MLPFLSPVLEIINKFIPSKDAQIELEKALSDNKVKLEESFKEYAKLDAEIRLKELENTGFKALWRPLCMFGFSGIMILYGLLYFIFPALVIYLDLNIYIPQPVDIPEPFYDLVLYSILGIAGLRSFDKFSKK